MLGILGGTFDPVHLGHTHIANQVLTRLDLEHIEFMPCAVPVHRDSPQASATQRCAMIELALRGNPRLRLNRLELERDGPSFTVDSLRQLHQDADFSVTGRRIVLILGGDAFNGFTRWKSPDEILELAHLVVCCRPGFSVDEKLFAEHRVKHADELRQRRSGAILELSVDAIECASSQLREALRSGQPTGQCLDKAVADYIEQHNLYRKSRD